MCGGFIVRDLLLARAMRPKPTESAPRRGTFTGMFHDGD